MKWINYPKNLPIFEDLVQQAREYLRRNLITVNKFPVKGKYKHLDRSVSRPWHILPSIQGFKIELSPNDWLLTLFGLKKRFPNSMVFDTWKNDDSNGYIEYMFNRLAQQVRLEKFEEAAKTIWILMNSPAYQGAALNHVLKNWHRKLPINQVLWVMKDVQKLARRKDHVLKYARVYLQETSKLRPLGVPAMSWRIYLHMYNNCIVQWRLISEGDKQHGYLPGRGIITAWRRISSKLSSRNIYEADFKGFFNNVTHKGLHKVLTETLGLPISEADWIDSLNKSFVKLKPADEILETDRFAKKDAKWRTNFESVDWDGMSADEALYYWIDGYWIQGKQDRKVLEKLLGPKDFAVLEFDSDGDPTMESISKLYHLRPDITERKEVGVPQGAPTSCSLATLALRSLEAKYEVIIYADDIIYFPSSSSCDPVKDLNDTFFGIEVNILKSKWLKRDGVWLVDSFKFLGIRYFPERIVRSNLYWIANLTLQAISIPDRIIPSRFVAETRKGANLEFTDRESFLSYLAIARELLLNSKYLGKRLTSGSLNDWVTSRLNFWIKLRNKSKLLFGEIIVDRKGRTFSQEYYDSLNPIIKRWVGKGMYKIVNPLTGYLLSRLQSNTWTISHKQDFTLTYNKDSWVATAWERYSNEWIVPTSKLNVFTASSFAIHDLIDFLTRGSQRRRKRRKPIIRRVLSKSPMHISEALNLRRSLRKDLIHYNESPFKLREQDPKGSVLVAKKEIHNDLLKAEAILPIIMDLILGFPLLTVGWILTRKKWIVITAATK